MLNLLGKIGSSMLRNPGKSAIGLIGAASLLDYGTVQYSRRLKEKYYGREIAHSYADSRLGAFSSELLGNPIAGGIAGAVAGGYLGQKLGKFTGRRFILGGTGAATGAFAGAIIGEKARQNPGLIAQGTASLGIGATVALAGFGGLKKYPGVSAPLLGAGIGIMATSGSSMIPGAMVGAAAGFAGRTAYSAVKYAASMKNSKLMNNALVNATGGIARFAGKKIGVDELKKKIQDLPRFPAFTGPILMGGAMGAAAGGVAGYNMPNIAPEYANQLSVSSGPTMPIDNNTAGLSLGMHRNRKRRRV